MAPQPEARSLHRLFVLVVGLVLLLPAPAAAQGRELRFGLGLTCTVAGEVADLSTTIYAHRRRADVAEGNPLYADGFEGDSYLGPALLKAAGTGAVVWGAWELERRDQHRWSQLLLWGNCAWKFGWSARNLAIASDAPTPRRPAQVILPLLQLRW